MQVGFLKEQKERVARTAGMDSSDIHRSSVNTVKANNLMPKFHSNLSKFKKSPEHYRPLPHQSRTENLERDSVDFEHSGKILLILICTGHRDGALELNRKRCLHIDMSCGRFNQEDKQ